MPFGLHRFFRYGVAAAGLHQTANQGQSRLALRLGRPAADTLVCAFENHPFPTSALQSDAITLRRAVGVRCQLDARAAAGQGPRGPIFRFQEAEPYRGPIQATRSGTVAHGCVAGSASPTSGFSQHLGSRSSLACLSSAVWLPGTVGEAPLWFRHGSVLLGRLVRSSRAAVASRLRRVQPGYGLVQPLAQIEDCRVQRQAGQGGPQVQSVAAGPAAKTVKDILPQVSGEGPAGGRA